MRMSRRDARVPSPRRDDAQESLRDSLEYLDKRRDESKKTLATPSKASIADNGIEALETAIGAGLFGYLAGRMGTTGIGSTGIPMGVAAWGVGQGISLFSLFGKKYDPHIARVANGALASSIALWAAGKGSQARSEAGGPVGPIVAGVVPSFDQVGAAPAYLSPVHAFPAQTNGMNPFAGPHAPRPLSEAELQGLSRGMP